MTSACAADNIAECVEHCLAGDVAHAISRQSPVADRLYFYDERRGRPELITGESPAPLPAADVPDAPTDFATTVGSTRPDKVIATSVSRRSSHHPRHHPDMTSPVTS